MKFEDLKIVQKWREYAGPKDERLEAENAKIYKIGFVLLSFGMLMILFYQTIARQVAWVHSNATEMPHLFVTPVEAAMVCVARYRDADLCGAANAKGLCRYQPFWANRASSCWILPARLRYQRGHERICPCGDALCCRGTDCAARKCLLGGELGYGRVLRPGSRHCHICHPVRSVLLGEKAPCQD